MTLDTWLPEDVLQDIYTKQQMYQKIFTVLAWNKNNYMTLHYCRNRDVSVTTFSTHAGLSNTRGLDCTQQPRKNILVVAFLWDKKPGLEKSFSNMVYIVNKQRQNINGRLEKVANW